MEVVHSSGSHERQFHVRVRVDATGDHQFIGGINDSHSFWNLKIQSNLNYFPIFDVDVADHGAVLVHNFASFNQDAAGLFHSCSAQLRHNLRKLYRSLRSDADPSVCSGTQKLCQRSYIRRSAPKFIWDIKGQKRPRSVTQKDLAFLIMINTNSVCIRIFWSKS